MKPTLIHKIILLFVCLWLPLQGAMAAMMGPCDGQPMITAIDAVGDSPTSNSCCDTFQNGLPGSCAHCAQCNLCSSPSILAYQPGTGIKPIEEHLPHLSTAHLELLLSLPFRPPIAA